MKRTTRIGRTVTKIPSFLGVNVRKCARHASLQSSVELEKRKSPKWTILSLPDFT